MTYIGLQLVEVWYPPESQNQEYVLNSCHHLVKVNDELVGDIIDVEMFKYSKGFISFDCQNPFDVITIKGEKLEILKIFDFSSNTQMMSVIVKIPNQEKFMVCSKGAPEKIFELMEPNFNKEESMTILEKFTSKGFRVISIATRWIDDIDLECLHREDIEKELVFCGFLFFENKLKKDTASVVTELKQANL